jgi:hypothetical protein
MMLCERLLHCNPPVALLHVCECVRIYSCAVQPLQFEGNRDGNICEH